MWSLERLTNTYPGACGPCAESRYDSYEPSNNRRIMIANELSELSSDGKGGNFDMKRIKNLQVGRLRVLNLRLDSDAFSVAHEN